MFSLYNAFITPSIRRFSSLSRHVPKSSSTKARIKSHSYHGSPSGTLRQRRPSNFNSKPHNPKQPKHNGPHSSWSRGAIFTITAIGAVSRTALSLLPLVPIGILLIEHVVDVKWVRGASMTPYLNNGFGETHLTEDIVLIDSSWAGRTNLKRGMVVIFPSLVRPKHVAVKRIIALPGDKVTTRPQPSRFGYTRQSPRAQTSQIVPWNHVWVEGDADDDFSSIDSNTHGPISMSLISGRVVCVLAPQPRMLRWEDWEGDDDEKNGEVAGKRQRARVEKNAVAVYAPDSQ